MSWLPDNRIGSLTTSKLTCLTILGRVTKGNLHITKGWECLFFTCCREHSNQYHWRDVETFFYILLILTQELNFEHHLFFIILFFPACSFPLCLKTAIFLPNTSNPYLCWYIISWIHTTVGTDQTFEDMCLFPLCIYLPVSLPFLLNQWMVSRFCRVSSWTGKSGNTAYFRIKTWR